jgi:hypothetical protein
MLKKNEYDQMLDTRTKLERDLGLLKTASFEDPYQVQPSNREARF